MPDYEALARLFMQPLLDQTDSLQTDCELSRGGKRVWLRVAFDSRDKGRVLGRGGRTLQAIRQVLGAAAELAGQELHLEVYEPTSRGGDRRPIPHRQGQG